LNTHERTKNHPLNPPLFHWAFLLMIAEESMTKPTYEKLERRIALLEELAAHQQKSEFKNTGLLHQTSRGVTCHRMTDETSGPPAEILYLETNPTEKNLCEPNADYRQLVDAMQELLFVVEKNGTLRFANQRASRFLAADWAAGVIGYNLRELLAPGQAEELLEGAINFSSPTVLLSMNPAAQ